MDITTLSDTELKALGFEQMELAQLHQNNVMMIKQELAKRASAKAVQAKGEGE